MNRCASTSASSADRRRRGGASSRSVPPAPPDPTDAATRQGIACTHQHSGATAHLSTARWLTDQRNSGSPQSGTAALTERDIHADADTDRLGLIGFSLGAATAMTFVATNPPGTVKVLGDFYGFLTPSIRAGVSRFPPTIIVHNKNDEVVPVKNSQELDRLLSATDHQLVPPCDERSEIGKHAFKPGGAADVDARSKVTRWFTTHVPPVGK